MLPRTGPNFISAILRIFVLGVLAILLLITAKAQTSGPAFNLRFFSSAPLGSCNQSQVGMTADGTIYTCQSGTWGIGASPGAAPFTGGAVTSAITGPDGTAGAPTFAFTSDADGTGTGIFRSAANVIGFSTNGTERWVINASGAFNPVADNTYDIGNGTVNPRDVNVSRNLVVGLGTVAAPTKFVVGDTSTSSPRGIMSWQSNTGTDGARFHGRKSRGTFGTPTTVVTGDTIVRFVGAAYDGSNFLEMASISFAVEGTVAATRTATNIIFSTGTDAAPSVLTDRWKITSAGHLLAVTDNVYDIGATGATRPRDVFVGRNVTVAGVGDFSGTTNAVVLRGSGTFGMAINGRGRFHWPSDGVALLMNDASTDFGRLQFGGTTSSFPALKRSSAALEVRLADDSAYANLNVQALFSNGVAFASLGTPTNGTFIYCSDCTKATPCASGGNGALAKRLNGAWDCN